MILCIIPNDIFIRNDHNHIYLYTIDVQGDLVINMNISLTLSLLPLNCMHLLAVHINQACMLCGY